MTFLALGLSYMLHAQSDSSQIGAQSGVASTNSGHSSDYQKFKLGIYGDMGLSWLKPKSSNYESEGARFSYNYGLVVDINFTENYTFSTGINVNSYGGKLNYTDMIKLNPSDTVNTRGLISRKYRINYIELPLLLKLKTNQMGYFTPFVQLGVRNSFRLNSYADQDFIYGGQTSHKDDIDIVDESSFYNIGFSVGFGTEYAISRTFSAFVILAYDNGLTSALNGENTLEDGTKSKQSAMFKKFGLTLGFLF